MTKTKRSELLEQMYDAGTLSLLKKDSEIHRGGDYGNEPCWIVNIEGRTFSSRAKNAKVVSEAFSALRYKTEIGTTYGDASTYVVVWDKE